jgi:hypothetical protein
MFLASSAIGNAFYGRVALLCLGAIQETTVPSGHHLQEGGKMGYAVEVQNIVQNLK